MFMKGGTVKTRNSILWSKGPQEVWFSTGGASSMITIYYTDVAGRLEGIATNSNGTVDWGEGNINEGPHVGGNYCLESPQWAVGTWYWGSPAIDKGDPSSQYNDEENLWCLHVWAYISSQNWPEGHVVMVPDTTTARNDMGAFGGPNGSWGIIYATPGSEW